MITAKKILAAIMAATLLVSTLTITGCKKKGNEEKISEDEAWYSVKKVQVGEQFLLEKDVDYSFVQFIGATDNRAVYLIDLHKNIPLWEASNAYDYSDLNESYLEIYGKDGSLERTINITQKIEDSDMFKLDPDDYPKIVERLRKEEDEKDGSATEKTSASSTAASGSAESSSILSPILLNSSVPSVNCSWMTLSASQLVILLRLVSTAAHTFLNFFCLLRSVEAAISLNSGMQSSYAGNVTRSKPLKQNVSGSTSPSDATSPAPLIEMPNVTPASMNVLTTWPTGVSIRSNVP